MSLEHDLASSASKKETKSAFSQKRLSETVSRKSNAERSLNFMQQRQASQNRSEVQSAKSLIEPRKLCSERKSGSQNEFVPVRSDTLQFLNGFLKD